MSKASAVPYRPGSSAQAESEVPTALPSPSGPILAGLSAAVLLVHGYHPYSEDGGIYIASAKHALDPSLYPSYTGFASAHIACALFGLGMAFLSQITHIPLAWLFFTGYIFSIWLTLFAIHRLAGICFSAALEKWSATCLIAAWFTLPVAGTSLDFMDPYFTARSLAFPLILLAAVEALGTKDVMQARSWRIAVLLLMGGLLHPLTAIYATFFLLLTLLLRARRVLFAVMLSGSAVVLAACLQLLARQDSPAYAKVVLSRGYWYLTSWEWYEWIGLIVPLLLLSWLARRGSRLFSGVILGMVRASILAGVTATLLNLLFAHPGHSPHLVASLQPLRLLQFVYLAMIMALGSLLAKFVLRSRITLWTLVFSAFCASLFFAQRAVFPGTEHLELPWRSPQNQWEQAFLWARDHSSRDEIFALDSHYISASGEDGQVFRAIAERSSLPDYSKDGGISSVKPELAPQWQTGAAAQDGLNTLSDRLRLARLVPLGASWLILPAGSSTALACPYRNPAVKVCKLPSPISSKP